MTTQNQKIIISFIIGIGIGGMSVWTLLSDERFSTNTNKKSTGLEELKTIRTANNIISVGDQTSGLRVMVDAVIFEKDGWVAIYEDSGGAPGNILGAQRFTEGEHKNGSVDLLRSTMPETYYYAILHNEDGDRAFNMRIDTPIIGIDGKRIMSMFKTLPE